MEPRFQPDRLWPTGHRQLQLMIIPDLDGNPGLAELVAACRAVMAAHPATTQPVPDESLHLTVQAVFRPGHGDVDQPTRARLIEALAPELAAVPAFEMLIGSPLAYHRGVVADTHHDDGFNHLLDRARRVIARICGPDAIAYDSRPAHMALCYADGRGSSDELQRQLRHHVRPSHASLTVTAVDLVETVQVPQRCRYDSTVLRRFSLSSRTEPSATSTVCEAVI
ncbi:hypothetical protein ABJI51_16785 [Amycolatopsis sp. NEAU-NG30]|uniref:2'-5' RNA ligase n=1 Tax=Amycolatopsis melonis TaxID=3156488 RepID=A0ABV0LEL4_9PSEU